VKEEFTDVEHAAFLLDDIHASISSFLHANHHEQQGTDDLMDALDVWRRDIETAQKYLKVNL
jgi:shikimate 5-dehydrogenase